MYHRLAAFAAVISFCGFAVSTPLLGAERCTWGPSFWCSNITNAKNCNAVKHCISTTWEKQHFPEDNDSICKICTDMVRQARDQLESNETQQDIKDVFDGSCKLIPIKIVRKECIKLSDEFIPEMIETLASQMNPTVVCSVAGLCNNVEIDKLLEEAATSTSVTKTEKCNGCYTVVNKMRNNFDQTPYEKFLENILRVCGKLGSFSDACATTVFTHFEEIYEHMVNHFNAENVCHVAGTCSAAFHQHPKPESTNVEITPMGTVGRLDDQLNGDIDCDLCKQLIQHLRDILIANTTEAEFKRVLDGICKQTGNFRSECLSIVDEYYPMMYSFLVNELDPKNACFLVGICKKGAKIIDGPIAPLLPVDKVQMAVESFQGASSTIQLKNERIAGDDDNSYKLEKNHKNVEIIQSQLPIDQLILTMPQNKEVCIFCQYFLHYVQQQISDDKTEEEIKQIVEKACKKLPATVENECETFVESYGNALIALLAQEIDPSTACPALTLCPAESEAKIEVLMKTGSDSKPNCPLCLFAVEQLETMLKDNRTEMNIQNALDNLCSFLPAKLKPECSDFVDTYSKQLIEMLAVKFTPQEVCVFLKICVDNKPDLSLADDTLVNDFMEAKMKNPADKNRFRKPLLPPSMLANNGNEKYGLIETNEIPDTTVNGKTLIYPEVTMKLKASPQCVICEFIMTQIDNELKDKATDDQIKKVVHGVCNHLPKNVKTDCNNFVDKYADAVIALLTQELSPKDVCTTLAMCNQQSLELKSTVRECAVCRELVDILKQLLSNPRIDRNIEHITEKACRALPTEYNNKCIEMMRAYGEDMIHYIVKLTDGGKICQEIGFCGSSDHTYVEMFSNEDLKIRSKRSLQLLGIKRCTWGPSYWCENMEQANECHALATCQTKYWMAELPPAKKL